ncbi:MAG: GGDEF domain-containing protein [Selenomonadaceae bacterium]|nr:GGDEF domain-containing protein [Selenomonadaceae bacterium]
MTQYGLYTFFALLFLVGGWYILRLRRQLALSMHIIAFHVGLSARLGILLVTYDAKRDEAVLSDDLARLLDLPTELHGLAAQKESILADEKHPWYPVMRALASLKEDARYQLVRRGMAPRHFLLRTYVMKDLAGTPAYLVGTLRDITERENEEARLAVKAQFDGLTRVHNSSATRAWMKAHVGQRPGALFLLDVDKFKTVNDTIGHQGGDQALICVANALRQSLGGKGFLGRLGGDEFICYLEENDLDVIDALADAIHENVTRLGEEACLGLPITVSIGCALLENEDYDAAYKKADGALYRAKNGGRNQHVIVGEPS